MRMPAIMLLLTLLLQGCGHKGALFIPQAQPVTQPSNQNQ